ncbi:MAG: DcrB-related protein [Bacteroidota bacterium]
MTSLLAPAQRRLLLALVACAGLLGPHAQAQGRVEPYRYRLAFDLAVPAGWTAQPDLGGAALVVLSPLSAPGDRFRENLNVSVGPVPAGRSRAEAYRDSRAALRAGLAGFEVLKAEETTVGVRAAQRVVYEHTFGGQRLRALAYLILADGRAYTLTGTALAERFEAAQPAFEQMAHSFRLN